MPEHPEGEELIDIVCESLPAARIGNLRVADNGSAMSFETTRMISRSRVQNLLENGLTIIAVRPRDDHTQVYVAPIQAAGELEVLDDMDVTLTFPNHNELVGEL